MPLENQRQHKPRNFFADWSQRDKDREASQFEQEFSLEVPGLAAVILNKGLELASRNLADK